MKYAYSQLRFYATFAKHCNFNIICGDSTGTDLFKTGFFGLKDMPADFLKSIDLLKGHFAKQ